MGLPPALAARALLTVRSEGGAVYALLIRKGDASLGLTIGTNGLEGADLAHTAWENWEETAEILPCASPSSFSMPNCWARPGPSPSEARHAGWMDSPVGANIYFQRHATQEHPHPLVCDQRALQEALERALSAEQRKQESPQRGGATPQAATPGPPPQEPLQKDPFEAQPRMRTVLNNLEEGGSCAERYRLLEGRLTFLLQAIAPGRTVASLQTRVRNLVEACPPNLLIPLTESRQALEFAAGEKPAGPPLLLGRSRTPHGRGPRPRSIYPSSRARKHAHRRGGSGGIARGGKGKSPRERGDGRAPSGGVGHGCGGALARTAQEVI